MSRATVTGRDAVSIDLSVFDAFLFDLDGVIIRTAWLHASAWKKLFDDLFAVDAAPPADRSCPSTRGRSLANELEGDTVCVQAMHCVAPSVRVAVNGEMHVGASEPVASA